MLVQLLIIIRNLANKKFKSLININTVNLGTPKNIENGCWKAKKTVFITTAASAFTISNTQPQAKSHKTTILSHGDNAAPAVSDFSKTISQQVFKKNN